MSLLKQAPKTSLNISILQRFLDPDEYTELLRDYMNARQNLNTRSYTPTKVDLECYKEFVFEDKRPKMFLGRMGVTVNTVQNRFAHIGRLIAKGELTL